MVLPVRVVAKYSWSTNDWAGSRGNAKYVFIETRQSLKEKAYTAVPVDILEFTAVILCTTAPHYCNEQWHKKHFTIVSSDILA